MKTDTLFYRLFLRCPQLALDLLGLPYNGDSYRFASEEIKQTAFRMDGLFKPIEDNQEHPLIFAEVQYQPDADFYGRFFSEITLYLYRQKPARRWLALVIYPERSTEKAAGIEFEPFMSLPQLQRIYLEDYQNRSGLTPTMGLMCLIAGSAEQTIPLAQELAKQRELIGADGLDFIETILVYKLPHLSREEIRKMLALNETQLKDTRFYQEIAQEERQEECVALLTRQLRRKFAAHPELEPILQQLPALPLARLEDLADALMDFTAFAELQGWLKS